MFDRVLKTSLPAEEKNDLRDAWIEAIDRPVLLTAIHACSDHFNLLILISKWKPQ